MTLIIICLIFIETIIDFADIGLGELFTISCTFLFILSLIVWTILFLIPLIKGKPALIIYTDSIFINSIKQTIPWSEIERTEIKRTKNNYIISIHVKNIDKVFVQPTSIIYRLICSLNELISNTPFSFSTVTVNGRAIDIYNEIKSGQNKAKLIKPTANI